MLKELLINNLAVIKNSEMEFTAKYTSLVGETGAGKSLIVDALSLLKGQKADFSLIRDKDKKASITAVFELDTHFLHNNPSISEIVDENNQLIIKRTIQKDHTSKFYLNDELYTLNEYRKIVEHLIDIHSQGSNNDILNENKQLFYLDTYGNAELKSLKQEYLNRYQTLQNNQTKLSNLIKDNKDYDREYLQYQIQNIEKYHLQEDEIENLNAEFDSLRQFEQIQKKYDDYLSLVEPQDSLSFRETALRVKNHLASYDSTSLKEPADQLINAINQLTDSLDNFEDAFSNLDFDPNRIDEINQRLFELKDLQRKYGKTSKEILSKLSDYKEKLNNIDNFEIQKYNLEQEIKKNEKQCLDTALILSEKRQKIAIKLSEHINSVLKELGLASDSFSIEFNKKELSESGIDKISFQIQMNKGLDRTSLEKAASGGEASRLMLAIKSVLNELDPYDVLVFDEIDTGVSGRIASLVAKQIRDISKFSQVIVISHLPQVVASSLSAFKVFKNTIDDETISSIEPISDKELTYEIAKLLSGEHITDSAIKQAGQLRSEYLK